jgi:hypothetical protein
MGTKKIAQELIDALKALRLEEVNLTAQLEEAIRDLDQEGTEQEAVQRERERTTSCREHTRFCKRRPRRDKEQAEQAS